MWKKKHCEKFSFNLIYFLISQYRAFRFSERAQSQMWVHPQGSDIGRQIKRTQSLSSLNQDWMSLENWCCNSNRNYGLDAEIISWIFLSYVRQEVRLDDNSPSWPSSLWILLLCFPKLSSLGWYVWVQILSGTWTDSTGHFQGEIKEF